MKEKSGRFNSNEKDVYIFWSEEYQVPAFEMNAQTAISVTVEMDWKENATRDFSLVVWGTGSPVTIEADGW